MKGLLRKGIALWDEFSTVSAETYASSIAYFAFVSLVPTLALCISLVSLMGIGQQEVLSFFCALVPDALDGLVETLVSDAFDRSGIALSLSTITLVWSASSGVKALRRGLNSAYAVPETRSTVLVAIISIVAIIALGAMVAALMYLIFSDRLLTLVSDIAPHLRLQNVFTSFLNPIALLAAGVFIFDVGYAYLPAGTRRLKTQLPGAIFSMVACGVFSFGFRIYVDRIGSYTLLYGSIATVALLLVWMYLTSYIILAGGFINHVLADKGDETQPQTDER